MVWLDEDQNDSFVKICQPCRQIFDSLSSDLTIGTLTFGRDFDFVSFYCCWNIFLHFLPDFSNRVLIFFLSTYLGKNSGKLA